MSGQALLSLRRVKKVLTSKDRQFTLEVDTFDLWPGELVLINGESGSGKSTFLELIGLATRPDKAVRFRFADKRDHYSVVSLHDAGDLTTLARLRAEHLGFVLQNGGLLPFLTLEENVALPRRLCGRAVADEDAWLLRQLDLEDLRSSYPESLSVGQRQRGAIAKAIAHRPTILLVDEPTAPLDPPNKARVVDLLLHVSQRFGAAVVIATHETAVFRALDLRRMEILARPVGAPGNLDVRAELVEAA